MKIFDRYIIRTFLKNYALALVVLIGLYIALDMVFHFDELARGGESAAGKGERSAIFATLHLIGNIAEFYFYQSFSVFVQLSGIIPVVAAAFTLVRMMRFNELTAMLAAGVPMLRIAAPILLTGVVLSGLLVLDQEWVIPQITHKLVRSHDQIGQTQAPSFAVEAMEDGAGSLLVAARYTPPGVDGSAKMEQVDVIHFAADRRPESHVRAESAVYDRRNKAWILTDGVRQTGLHPRDPVTRSQVTTWQTDIGPEEIGLYRTANYADLLSTQQINALLDHPKNYGIGPLLRVKHWRLVQPLANIVLLLLAVPCVLTREPGAVKMAATKTVLLTGACVAAMFIAHQIARRPPAGMESLWPAMILWAPLFIFAPLAVYLMDRVKS